MTLADLNGHLDMLTQLQKARTSLQTLQDRILGAQKYDGMPHGTEASRTVENLAIILEGQMDDVARLERIVERSEKDIRKWIDTIQDNRTKLVFSLRFLCGLGWQEVADHIGGGNSFDSVRMVVYRYLNITSDTE